MITIFCEEITPRVSYTFEFVFTSVLGVDFTLTADREAFASSSGVRFAYGNEAMEGALQFRAAGLLGEEGVLQQSVDVGECRGYPALFKVGRESALEYDLFSAIFFLVTRYEEYLPHQTDKHGRYLAGQSTASQHGFLERPIVDVWAQLIGEVLMKEFPGLKFTERKFRYINTIDIDNAYAYVGKGAVRNVGGIVKSAMQRDSDAISERLGVLSGKTKDPYDTYAYMKAMAEECETEVKSFVLLGDYGAYDKNLPHSSTEQITMVKKMNEFSDVGIHPSYGSGERAESVQKEIRRLEEILDRPICSSRQHFLKMSFPETYRTLIANGIEEDYSMGYSEVLGFRAGTCTPFKFYDLQANESTNLTVYPFAVMDRTLNDHLKLSPEEAIDRVSDLFAEVEAVHGTLVSVWHNESLSNKREWLGWVPVYEHLQRAARAAR